MPATHAKLGALEKEEEEAEEHLHCSSCRSCTCGNGNPRPLPLVQQLVVFARIFVCQTYLPAYLPKKTSKKQKKKGKTQPNQTNHLILAKKKNTTFFSKRCLLPKSLDTVLALADLKWSNPDSLVHVEQSSVFLTNGSSFGKKKPKPILFSSKTPKTLI